MRSASLDGQPVPYLDIPNSFDFLRDETDRIEFTDRYTFDVQFGDTERDISELFVSNARATDRVSLLFQLQSATGEEQYATRLDLEPNVSRQLLLRLPGTIRASRLHVMILGPPVRATVELYDVRVLGQTPELSAYIKKTLRFSGAAVVNRPER